MESDNKRIKLSRLNICILYFFIFAFIGWLLETFYSLYELGHFTKRGFLLGPICPIYGFGALILILFFSKYKNNNLKLFFYSAIVFSLFEYLVGFGLDALFGLKFWDYTSESFNLNGRISIFFSFAWGIIAIIFINHLYPFIKRKINVLFSKTPYKLQISIVRILCIVFFADTIVSCFRYLI